MNRVALSEIALEARPGFASGKSVADGVVQVRMNNIATDGALIWDKVRRVPPPKKIAELLAEPGDILFNATNSPELVGKSALFGGYIEPVTFSNHFVRLRLDRDRAAPEYVIRYLHDQWSRRVFENMCKRWVNQASISKDDLLSVEIPLPPLEEQKRIAAILDQADSLRRLRQRAIDRLNTLGQAIFYEMFGDLEEIDGERLGDHTTKIGSGATPKGGGSAYKSSGIPLVRSMNVRDGYFDPTGLAYIDEQQAKSLDNVILQENDVLLNITGASVARVCRAPTSVVAGRVNQHVSIIRTTNAIQPEFLEEFLLFPKVKRKLLSIAESGATRQAITKSQIEELQVPVPKVSRQIEFVRRKREAIDVHKSAHSQLDRMNQLFSSLQHRAFRGDL